MKNAVKHYPVNWTEGMKLNKDIFIAQDNAVWAQVSRLQAAALSPVRYGLLPGYEFDVRIAADNQQTVRVSIISCTALTIGGVLIDIQGEEEKEKDGYPSVTKGIAAASDQTVYWAVLLIQPFEREPFGEVDPNESPARLPFVKSSHRVELIENSQLSQYEQHPYALIIGKIAVAGHQAVVDEHYLPPCFSVSASQDLMGLHAELDSFLAGLEQNCSLIVQKIYKKSQNNELSELARFLCDRVILFLSQAITDYRWLNLHDSPVVMISRIVALARTIKNTIDLRTGSGREELMNYLCEWCDLNQGGLDSMLSNMAQLRYNHNDINQSVDAIIVFAKTIGKLFSTLGGLEFIGKRKESGLFVKEEASPGLRVNEEQAPKPRRRFFG
ncbi:hypothetical protein ABDK00_018475 [Niabella insulamsoli]|uniref:hypothetical protein n=1 Tax=Niabella insulamsoli TaxID=3144874 RepID=UPI0031FBC816